MHSSIVPRSDSFWQYAVQVPAQDTAAADSTQAELLQRLTQFEAAAHARAITHAAFEAAKDSADRAEREAAAQDSLTQQAADAAAGMKAYVPWSKKEGEFDSRPQVPQPGTTFKYFDTENGISAARADPLLQGAPDAVRKALPARGADLASSAVFPTPGVYRARDDDVSAPTWHDMSEDHASAYIDEDAAETPLKSIKMKSSKHSASAQHVHGHGGSPVRSPPTSLSPTRCTIHSQIGITQTGATGGNLPRQYKQQHASAELNIEVLQREYETMRLTNTASAAQVRARGHDGTEFVLGAAALRFGSVHRGVSVTKQLQLQNVALGAARFSVDQVAAPLSVKYTRAPVPVGLKVQINVTFAAGAEEALGEWQGEVVVRSAFNVLRCPVSANVLESQE